MMYGLRRMSPGEILTGAILLAIIMVPAIVYLPHYMKQEAMLRDLPVKISQYISKGRFQEADELVAKAETDLGENPNNLTPLRAVTRLNILAMNLAEYKDVEKEKLEKLKENLQKFKTITNGYRTYRELIQKSERLVKKIEDSNGRIFFDKDKNKFKIRN